MLPDKYGIHEKTVKKADGSYRSLPMLRIHYYFISVMEGVKRETHCPGISKKIQIFSPPWGILTQKGSYFSTKVWICF